MHQNLGMVQPAILSILPIHVPSARKGACCGYACNFWFVLGNNCDIDVQDLQDAATVHEGPSHHRGHGIVTL
jgi:hypothetical protein